MIEYQGLQLPQTPQASRKFNFSVSLLQPTQSSGKKRVGDYTYNLRDIIGSGYSSQVFKCHRRDEPGKILAIKVIKLSKLNKTNLQLLQNEIKILQAVDHPNIIKFHNFYYTENNCYLITDYCEGGTLQDHIDQGEVLNHGQIFEQLISGCKYLEQKLIMHRDIKPANVFKMGSKWKIGDFGFACFISSQETVLKQTYKIGSPLYMAPQTHKQCLYCLKTDSFALGITLFYLMTKRYPWYGTTNKQLLKSYKMKKFPINQLSHLPQRIQKCIQSLCMLDMDERILMKQIILQPTTENIVNPQSPFKLSKMKSLETCTPEASDESEDVEIGVDKNYALFLGTPTLPQTNLPNRIEVDLIQKIKLYKFVHNIHLNIPQSRGELQKVICSILSYLIKTMQWQNDAAYKSHINEFNYQQHQPLSTIQEVEELKQLIIKTIQELQTGRDMQRRMFVLRLKLIQLRFVMGLLCRREWGKMREFANKVVLVQDFGRQFISPSQAQQIQKLMII